MSEFKLTMPLSADYVVRSETTATGSSEEWMYLEGEVTDTQWDRKRGKVYPEAIRAMVDTVNGVKRTPMFGNSTAAVGIDVEHSDVWRDQIGQVVEAKVIERANGPAMWIKARVDMGMSAGKDLKRALDNGAKLGWSIFGHIPPGQGYRDHEGREHFKQIELKKIRITSKPVNPNTWLSIVARSMDYEEENVLDVETVSEQTSSAAPTLMDRYSAFAAELRAAGLATEADALDVTVNTIVRGNAAPIETPAEVPADPPAEVPVETVARSDGSVPVALIPLELPVPTVEVAPEAESAPVNDMDTIIRSLPTALAETDGKISELELELRRSFTESDELRRHVNQLTEVMTFLLKAPGPRHDTVARSFGDGARNQPENSPLAVWAAKTPAEHARRYRELSDNGQSHVAAELMLAMNRNTGVQAGPDLSGLSPAAKAMVAKFVS